MKKIASENQFDREISNCLRKIHKKKDFTLSGNKLLKGILLRSFTSKLDRLREKWREHF